jgi:hypothetical protein
VSDSADLEEVYEPEQLVLSDLVNRVLDKGVVIHAKVMIGVADIDLIQLDLRLLISSVASLVERQQRALPGADVPVRPDSGR